MKRLLIIALLAGTAFAQGGTTSANLDPATTGQHLGTNTRRWNVMAQDLDVSRNLTVNGNAVSTVPANPGTDGKCLVTDGTQPLGLKWGACADDSSVVHKSGDETVNGVKTFPDGIVVGNPESSGKGHIEVPSSSGITTITLDGDDGISASKLAVGTTVQTGNNNVRAFSSLPFGAFKVLPTPILPAGNYPADWDGSFASDPWLMRDASQYYLYYWGAGDSGAGQLPCIGYATSNSFTSWTKSVSNPVLCPSGAAWDTQMTHKPTIVQIGSTYYMYYEGMGASYKAIGLATATSLNGPWTRWNGGAAPVLTPGGTGENGNYLAPVAFSDGGTYHLFYGAQSTTDFAWRVFHATSTDGTTWAKQGKVLDVSSNNADWDYGWLAPDSVIKAGPYYVMAYNAGSVRPLAAQNEPNDSGCGLAYSTDLTSWTKFNANPILYRGITTLNGSDMSKVHVWRCHLFSAEGKFYIAFNQSQEPAAEQTYLAVFDPAWIPQRNQYSYKDNDSAYEAVSPGGGFSGYGIKSGGQHWGMFGSPANYTITNLTTNKDNVRVWPSGNVTVGNPARTSDTGHTLDVVGDVFADTMQANVVNAGNGSYDLFPLGPDAALTPLRRGITWTTDGTGLVTFWANSNQSAAGYQFKDGKTGVIFGAIPALTSAWLLNPLRVGGPAVAPIVSSAKLPQYCGTITTTAAASDALTCTNTVTGDWPSRCTAQATNATAAGLTGVYAATSNATCVVYHSATSGGTFDVYASY